MIQSFIIKLFCYIFSSEGKSLFHSGVCCRLSSAVRCNQWMVLQSESLYTNRLRVCGLERLSPCARDDYKHNRCVSDGIKPLNTPLMAAACCQYQSSLCRSAPLLIVVENHSVANNTSSVTDKCEI